MAEQPPILDRARDLARLAAEPAAFDVLVIGGGINGAATFRDLALQGVRAVLVDALDIAAGASSASTRMAHGGLRYLENGELRLVAEATFERNRLMRNAPHYLCPLPVAIPVFARFSGALAAVFRFFGRDWPLRLRGLEVVRLGLRTYDWLGRKGRVLPRYRIESAAEARRHLPDLHPAVRGVATYYDARITQAERLNLELVEDALLAKPASAAINHLAVTAFEGGEIILQDRLSGRRLAIRPKLVVNAGGAWIDRVNAALGIEGALIGGTKGAHLVLDCPALHRALGGRAFSFDDGAGRLCIVYPMGDRVLLGSTDIRLDDPDAAVCDAAETAYLLGAIRLIFPLVDVGPEHIRFRFSGVRPLPRATRQETGTISRDHAIERTPPTPERPWPVLSLIGGKWTTFRAFAEVTTDAVLAELGRKRKVATHDLPIGGGRDYPADPAGRTALEASLTGLGVDPSRAASLVERFGTRASRVGAFLAAGPDQPLGDAPETSRREIAFHVRHEMAMTLGDLVFRRTTLALDGRLTAGLLQEIAAVATAELGQDSAWQAAELAALAALLKERHGVDLGPLAPAPAPAKLARGDAA